jgi:hypothetical protein
MILRFVFVAGILSFLSGVLRTGFRATPLNTRNQKPDPKTQTANPKLKSHLYPIHFLSNNLNGTVNKSARKTGGLIHFFAQKKLASANFCCLSLEPPPPGPKYARLTGTIS